MKNSLVRMFRELNRDESVVPDAVVVTVDDPVFMMIPDK